MRVTQLSLSILVAGSLIVPALHAEEQGTPSVAANKAMEETVTGKVEEKLQINKPAPELDLDIKDIIESGTAQTDDVLQAAKPIPSSDDFAHYATLSSNQVLRPWMPLIPEPPLVTFYPGLSKVAARRWEFRVSDENGEMVKVIKGKGVPPRQIEWNGINERGQFITVGTIYSYQFVTFDEHGNAHTFPGEPFQLDALRYEQKGKIVVEFANKRLFQDDKAGFRPIMQGMWERALDVIRENSNKPLTVEMFADNTKSPLVEDRRQSLLTAVSDATNLPAVDIRHKVEKIADRGDVVRLVMSPK